MSGIRSRTIALAPLVIVLLASCGGGSADQNASATSKAGTTAPPTTVPEQGASGATGTQKQPSATGKAKKNPAKPKQKAKPRSEAGNEVLQREAAKLKKKLEKLKKQQKGTNEKGGKSPTKTTPSKPLPAPKPGGTPEQVLQAKAKRVCHDLGINGVAHRIDTAPSSPEAVATAYAQTYPPPLQSAVHDGCLAGFTGG